MVSKCCLPGCHLETTDDYVLAPPTHGPGPGPSSSSKFELGFESSWSMPSGPICRDSITPKNGTPYMFLIRGKQV